ncbi:hypothetical protein ACFLWH_00345 [Chloroflexota bacterium]
MKSQIQDFEVVSSGYWLPRWGSWAFGAGCLLINRETLARITFRCYEFKNGEVINEDTVLDMDLFSCHARVNKGIFVSIKHYKNNQEYYAIKPQPMGWFQKLNNTLLVGYMLTKISILAKYNIAGKLHTLLGKFPNVSAQT